MVLSITAFNSGNSENIIPDTAKLLGTTRTFDNELREKFPEILERIIRGVCESNRAGYKFKYNFGTPATINYKETAEFGQEVLREIVGDDGLVKIEPRMGGEDFAKYLLNIPGALMTLGALKEGYGYPHHNSKFNIDESSFKIGTEYFIRYAVEYFKE